MCINISTNLTSKHRTERVRWVCPQKPCWIHSRTE